ncbi:hypothetical protein GLYMA_05G221800v4 [Glycine max]|uniref:Uncharacterized protein n=1 Tax=Glycine max TaxID=3847 RepID=I1K647_SOYBN|nr:uncharacterized protein LOC100796930 [Glycine max]KAG5058707.1 hypothetical protein JHK86_013703 [Glycine max]KAH1135752.1 hypothetical protein GYH30_013460 [Glycine max]KRH60127.1 hypothetical protein GLYMA_05G221800v4 [Glycine max]|eukprot:NP_001241896.2 uncharacterized protein LOC100796930 [Glycine max]
MALHRLLKRKGGVDELNDDFPLASPATKIRRLDAELPPILEEDEPLPNEERALVLFKPLVHSPSSFSLTLDSDLMKGIRNNQYLWSKQCERVTELESREEENDDELALVPWVPSPSYQFSAVDDSLNTNVELMEADEMGEGEGVGSMMMDIEQEDDTDTDTDTDAKTSTSSIHYPTTHDGITEGFQQHCLLPKLPHNTSTPITWTR